MLYENLFYTVFLIWYFSVYGIPYHLFVGIRRLYQKISNTLNFIQNFNDILITEKLLEEVEHTNPIPKYEDKYLDEFRKMDNELILDEKEQELKDKEEKVKEGKKEVDSKKDEIQSKEAK